MGIKVNYKIIENFLKEKDILEIEKILFSDYFPWYHSNEIVEKDNQFYFFHNLMKDNNILSNYFYKITLPILINFKDEIKYIHRIRINCFTNRGKQIAYGQHTDHDFSHKILLYYVNTNNGYTYLNNKYKINSIRNNLAIINGDIPHEIISQNDTNLRLTINITYN